MTTSPTDDLWTVNELAMDAGQENAPRLAMAASQQNLPLHMAPTTAGPTRALRDLTNLPVPAMSPRREDTPIVLGRSGASRVLLMTAFPLPHLRKQLRLMR